MIDLKDASRETLIRLVVAQHETIQQQERIIADLHAEVARLSAQVTALTVRVGTLIAALETATCSDDGTGSRRGQGMTGLTHANVRVPASKRVREDRSAAVGEECAGVLVSDVYAGYAPHDGVKQQCWAHLVRDVHDLRVAPPKDAAVQAWTAVQAVDTPFIGVPVPQRVLSARRAKHLHELFVFVVEPDVPPDNNRAERALRHLVTSRKISGGTRSAAGSAAKMALATLFGTWRLRGENPYTACRALLVFPHP